MKIIFRILTALLLIILMLIACVVGFFMIWKNVQDGQYDVDMTKTPPALVQPIKTKREAINQAIHYGITHKENFDFEHKNLTQHNDWSLNAYQKQKNWQVILKTKNIIPSYQCVMIINEGTKLVKDEGCGWNK